MMAVTWAFIRFNGPSSATVPTESKRALPDNPRRVSLSHLLTLSAANVLSRQRSQPPTFSAANVKGLQIPFSFCKYEIDIPCLGFEKPLGPTARDLTGLESVQELAALIAKI